MTLFCNPDIQNRLRTIEAAKKFSSSGGKNRAKSLSSTRRSEIASNAAKARWKNLQENAYPEMVPGQVYAC